MSIDPVFANAVYVLPQTVSPLSAVELALAARSDVGPPAGSNLSSVVSRLQEAHREALQQNGSRPQYIDVQEIHLLPTVPHETPTVVTSANRVDVYV